MSDGRLIKGKETKDKILYATLIYISDHGIKSLSASKIAKLAGVSKSNVFHHFGSVEELPFLCMTHLCDTLMSTIDIEGCQSSEDLFIQLGESTFIDDLSHIKAYRAFFVLYNESFHDERFKAIINKMKIEFVDAIVGAVNHFEQDLIDQTALARLAELITIQIDGLGMHFMIDGDVEAYNKLWRLQVEMLLVYIEGLKRK